MLENLRIRLLILAVAAIPVAAFAGGAGKVKTLAGEVTIERSGTATPATPGATVQPSDRITTGPDGSVGVLLDDDSRISLGPNSSVTLDRFDFDPATDTGAVDLSMIKGILSVISGKITRKTPGALKVRTPTAVIGVRGTEFSVKVDQPDAGSKRP